MNLVKSFSYNIVKYSFGYLSVLRNSVGISFNIDNFFGILHKNVTSLGYSEVGWLIY